MAYLEITDVQLLYPEMSDEEAQRMIDLVTKAFDAHRCEDREVDPSPPVPDPTPERVEYGLLLWISQIHGAVSGAGSAMTSERIGDYSYTITGGAPTSEVLGGVPDDVVEYLVPYICDMYMGGDAYELTIWPRNDVEAEEELV